MFTKHLKLDTGNPKDNEYTILYFDGTGEKITECVLKAYLNICETATLENYDDIIKAGRELMEFIYDIRDKFDNLFSKEYK